MKVWVNVPRLLYAGTLYNEGDVTDVSMTRHTRALINEGVLLTRPPVVKRVEVDVAPEISDNEETNEEMEVEHGQRRTRKSRKVRPGGETVSEGLPRAESSD